MAGRRRRYDEKERHAARMKGVMIKCPAKENQTTIKGHESSHAGAEKENLMT